MMTSLPTQLQQLQNNMRNSLRMANIRIIPEFKLIE